MEIYESRYEINPSVDNMLVSGNGLSWNGYASKKGLAILPHPNARRSSNGFHLRNDLAKPFPMNVLGERMNQVILIDGKNFVYRQHATHSSLSCRGFPTGVLYACPQALLSLSKRFPEAALVFIWDGEGETWRHKLLDPLKRSPEAVKSPQRDATRVKTPLPDFLQAGLDHIKQNIAPSTRPARNVSITKIQGYKANREATRLNFADARKQIPLFQHFMERLGIKQFEVNNLEGDDLVGVLATQLEQDDACEQIIIHSSDKDFYQFMSDKIKVLRSEREGGFATRLDIETEFGVPCSDYTKLRAVIGDTSDNIPHLFMGVGVKTAAKWIRAGLDPRCKSWEQLPARVREDLIAVSNHDIRGKWEDIHRNYIACQIVRDTSHPLLPVAVKSDIDKLLGNIKPDSLHPDKKKRTEDTWRWMTDFFARYELVELLARRTELWQL